MKLLRHTISDILFKPFFTVIFILKPKHNHLQLFNPFSDIEI